MARKVNVNSVQVVVPMAGSGSRFVTAGYEAPKPLLPIHGVPMYKLVLSNLLSDEVGRIIIVTQRLWRLEREIDDLRSRISSRVELVEIDYLTSGPSETVALARPFLDPELPVVTGNSDQYVDASLDDFYSSLISTEIDGSILTMRDQDPKWSYVAVDGDGFATEVREKQVISPYATVGIYGFARASRMLDAFDSMKQARDTVGNEYYVGPSYNYLIRGGAKVGILDLGPISTVMHGLGTPNDYESFLTTHVSIRAADKARELGLA